jgi:hypothetical protein
VPGDTTPAYFGGDISSMFDIEAGEIAHGIKIARCLARR